MEYTHIEVSLFSNKLAEPPINHTYTIKEIENLLNVVDKHLQTKNHIGIVLFNPDYGKESRKVYVIPYITYSRSLLAYAPNPKYSLDYIKSILNL